jgi:alkylation response protein AidB-like acyl-CoA dehydrogenase
MDIAQDHPNMGIAGIMDPQLVARSPEILELERLAVEEFRPRGRQYDLNCEMPVENIQELFDRGWLQPVLPKAWGGKGSNLETDDPATYLQVIRALARGCSSTAHCLQVHNHALWFLNGVATEHQRRKYIMPVFEAPRLTAFVASEAKRKQQYMLSTQARRVAGGWVITGEKNYATNAPFMGFVLVAAAIENEPDYTKNHLVVIIPEGAEGMVLDNDWYRPNGMRAASSPIVQLNDVFVPDEDVVGDPGIYIRGRWQGKMHLGFTANYLGTTEGMYKWYLDYVRAKGRAKDPIIQLRTGEMKIALEAAAALFHRAIMTWKTGTVIEAELISQAAKSACASMAFEVSHKIVHASGSTAMFDEFPLSRYIRDLETHVLHAFHDKSAQTIGKSELGESFDSTTQV